ncbi:hypothetical protein JAAARDRAFT_122179 [Jaapia argillacea MUCL 33604]|uniref:BTB domain-containing protein n=1 Tax=Jaapia argillacea MUCL 33604 TaxID=933084 RepID=A0A067Q6L0_9AGAM|nr:hypothetical protein JAAARDRAFT_122179 [Jaapia argillacea MUCL 33604]
MSSNFIRDSMLRLSIPTRDSLYYISDGNTVLLVENTLFKVHRSTLVKDGSSFETLFSLPCEAPPSSSNQTVPAVGPLPEGESDDNPIHLHDTADQFRALLWALYALPHELMVATTAEANPVLLYHLAQMAHKYQFKSLLSWVLSALFTFYTRFGALDTLPSSSDDTAPATGPTLVQLTELASLCECTGLLDATITRWKKLISEGQEIALAILIAERLNIRTLLGMAYSAMLLKGRKFWDAEPLLNRDQRIRLLSGHYSLSRLSEKLPLNPPVLLHTARCPSPPRCSKAWAALWKQVLDLESQVAPMESVDVVRKLRVAEAVLVGLMEKDDSGGSTQLCPENPWLPYCKESALASVALRGKEIRDGLADHFTDVF